MDLVAQRKGLREATIATSSFGGSSNSSSSSSASASSSGSSCETGCSCRDDASSCSSSESVSATDSESEFESGTEFESGDEESDETHPTEGTRTSKSKEKPNLATMVIHGNLSRDLFDSGSLYTDVNDMNALSHTNSLEQAKAHGAKHRGKHNNKTVIVHVGKKGKKARKHHSRQQTQASNLTSSCNAISSPRQTEEEEVKNGEHGRYQTMLVHQDNEDEEQYHE